MVNTQSHKFELLRLHRRILKLRQTHEAGTYPLKNILLFLRYQQPVDKVTIFANLHHQAFNSYIIAGHQINAAATIKHDRRFGIAIDSED